MAYVTHEVMENTWQEVASKGIDAAVGIHVFHVIVEAFSRVAPRPGKVRQAAIQRVQALPAGELAQQASQCEPHVAQYLVDALAEEDDEVVLSEEERAHCACGLQAVTLCLHRACERR